MKPWAIFAVRVIAVIVLLCIIGAVGAYLATILFGGVGGDRVAKLDETPDQHLIHRGAYIAVLGDCAACHTAPGGADFAGGFAIATPIGAVYTTNITPDKTTGIGDYTLGDFERAVRRGIRPDGSALYPAMPFPSYAQVSDADVKALCLFPERRSARGAARRGARHSLAALDALASDLLALDVRAGRPKRRRRRFH
jgi:alcohol dehydrogenase (quinone), cytochrome c subunit